LAARGLQGLGAALLQPAILGLIGTSFPDGGPRARAYAVWGSVGAAGLVAGVVLGGLLTASSWRWTFFINVPLCAVCAGAAIRWFPRRSGNRGGTPVPAFAAVLGTAAVLALVTALTLVSNGGADKTAALGAFVVAAAAFAAFAVNERRSANALIDGALRRTRAVRYGAAATALYMASVGAEFYLVTLLMQTLKGYTPFEAGFAFLPLAAMVSLGSATAGWAMRGVPAPSTRTAST